MSDVLALTPYGALDGVRMPTGLAFLGVRYGHPPVGALRWKPPSPWRPESGRFDATRLGAAPPQTPSLAASWRAAFAPSAMSEDCLNLNVWTPAADAAKRPVLVHVFGGGFETGSASDGFQDGAALSAQGDAVVVRVNFRVGALGFLHLGDAFGPDYAATNRGALDLVLALEWVRTNIAALGGDPDNVTLFGLSSGAFMIAALFAMPASKGLFAKAWMQSGSASRVLTREQGAAVAEEFFREAGRADLETLDVATILAAQRKAASLDLGDRNAPGGRTLGIVEDGASLAEHPMRVFARGDRRDVPIVLGFARDEARLWFAIGAMRLPGSFDELEAEMTRFAGSGEAGGRLHRFYRARFPAHGPAELREAFLTDAVYVAPALRTAMTHAQAGGRAFLYRFDATPPGEFAKLGASHGFDEAFVWNQPQAAIGGAGDGALAGALSSALLSFTRDASPGWSGVEAGSVRVFGSEAEEVAVDRDLLDAWTGVERR